MIGEPIDEVEKEIWSQEDEPYIARCK